MTENYLHFPTINSCLRKIWFGISQPKCCAVLMLDVSGLFTEHLTQEREQTAVVARTQHSGQVTNQRAGVTYQSRRNSFFTQCRPDYFRERRG